MTRNCADSKRLVGCLALPLIFFVCLGVADISIWSARDSQKHMICICIPVFIGFVFETTYRAKILFVTWDSHLDKKLFFKFGYWWGWRELLLKRIICVCRKVCSTFDEGEGARGAPRGEAREQQKRHWQSLLHQLEPRSRSSLGRELCYSILL